MRRMRRLLWVIVTVLLVVAGVGAMTAPATTRQGVNFKVATHTLPQYVKALDFMNRHFHYRLLAQQITQGLHTDEERALAVYRWTRERIRPTPRDWAVVDDHIDHIIIRGHGFGDQMADVFATLSTYAGVPSFWVFVRPPGGSYVHVLTFANVDERWAVFDIEQGVVFRDAQGRLATLEQLLADPDLVTAQVGRFQPDGLPYSRYLAAASPLEVPSPLRAELQMPGVRVWYELRRKLGVLKS